MENIKKFLESSTIHGLSYISTERQYVRLFWITVAMVGFTGAGVIIHQSFQSWAESPVKTTIETRPIKEITFPKVTVCPPKNSYTDLNYDLLRAENMTLDKDIRSNLTDYAAELMLDRFYDNVMAELNKLQEKNRYYNWYHGYSRIQIIDWSRWENTEIFETSAVSGAITTQYFGDKFDADKVETSMAYSLALFPIKGVDITNVTLCIQTERMPMTDLPRGVDQLLVLNYSDYRSCFNRYGWSAVVWNSYGCRICRNVEVSLEKKCTSPGDDGYVYGFWRQGNRIEDVRNYKSMDFMPGSRVSWYYTGLKMKPIGKYFNDTITKYFVRY